MMDYAKTVSALQSALGYSLVIGLSIALTACGSDSSSPTGTGNGSGDGNGSGNDSQTVTLADQQAPPYSVLELSLVEEEVELSEEIYDGFIGETDIEVINSGDGELLLIVPDLDEGHYEVIIDTESVLVLFDLEILEGEQVEDIDQYLEEYTSSIRSGLDESEHPELEEVIREFEELERDEQEVAVRFLVENRAMFVELDEMFGDFGLASLQQNLSESDCDRWCLLDRGSRLVNSGSRVTHKVHRLSQRASLRRGITVGARLISRRMVSYLPRIVPVVEQILDSVYWPKVEEAVLLTVADDDEAVETDLLLVLRAESGEAPVPELNAEQRYSISVSPVPFRTLNEADSENPDESIAGFVRSYNSFHELVQASFDRTLPGYRDRTEDEVLQRLDQIDLAVDDEEVEIGELAVEEDSLNVSFGFVGESPGEPFTFSLGVNISFREHVFSREAEVRLVGDGEEENGDDDEVSVTADFTVEPDDPETGETVTLDASATSISGEDVTPDYFWTLLLPPGSGVDLSDRTAETVSFVPDWPGDYEVTLEVSMGEVSDSKTVVVTVTGDEPGDGDGEEDPTPSWSTLESGLNTQSIVELSSVSFRDQDHGWIAGSQSTLLHTSDGGDTWSLNHGSSAGYTGNYTDVQYLDSGTAYAISDDGWFHANSNGQTTWTSVELDLQDLYGNHESGQHESEGPQLFSLYFADDDNGWIAGAVQFIHPDIEEGLVKPLVLRTSNGGEDWVVQVDPMDQVFYDYDAEATFRLNSVHFIDNQYGWAVGTAGLVMHTEDGGDIWEILNIPQTPADYSSLRTLNSVQFVDAHTGWAVGVSGRILRSDNGGESWTEQRNTMSTKRLTSVHFIDSQTGWATGDDVVLSTSDGGSTWGEKQIHGITDKFGNESIAPLFTSIQFLDGDIGWAIGPGIDGTIVRYAIDN